MTSISSSDTSFASGFEARTITDVTILAILSILSSGGGDSMTVSSISEAALSVCAKAGYPPPHNIKLGLLSLQSSSWLSVSRLTAQYEASPVTLESRRIPLWDLLRAIQYPDLGAESFGQQARLIALHNAQLSQWKKASSEFHVMHHLVSGLLSWHGMRLILESPEKVKEVEKASAAAEVIHSTCVDTLKEDLEVLEEQLAFVQYLSMIDQHPSPAAIADYLTFVDRRDSLKVQYDVLETRWKGLDARTQQAREALRLRIAGK
ncbi:hypothetical protein NMY22_g14750 [Coprinellus aureogranulatus]|nr:hypothetical protein NMY22_g14750 [Coprinellus aureogranulatus]